MTTRDGASAGATRWIIHGERLVDDTRRARVSIADVELPDGVRFEQWVLRLPRAAVVVVLNDRDEALMMWRHRFIIDRWVWELPGGYIDEDQEDPAVSAAREVEEETGWLPGPLEPLLSFQPMVGTADSENLLFLARGAVYVGEPADINEADRQASSKYPIHCGSSWRSASAKRRSASARERLQSRSSPRLACPCASITAASASDAGTRAFAAACRAARARSTPRVASPPYTA